MKQAFCTSCRRTVYRGRDDADVCPVCSSPLVLTEAQSNENGRGPAVANGTTNGNAEAAAGAHDASGLSAAERLRLAAVNRYEILDTPPDGSFDRITRLAARIFGVPIATITIVDHDRIWFKSKYGIDAEQIGRDPGLCASAVLEYEPWIVEDAATDPRTLENPLVRGELGLRFYAGAPLRTADGYNLGTLNIIDREPRLLRDDEVDTLKMLADIVVDELELRLAALRLYRRARESGLDADVARTAAGRQIS